MLRKGVIILIIGLFIGASVIPSISGNLLKNTIAQDKDINKEDINIKNNNLNGEVHDWTMFHHDLMHTGYTEGKGTITYPCEKWSKQYSGWVESSPALVDIDDDDELEVVFGCFDGEVYCLNADNGNYIWNYTTGGEVFSSPAIANGKVYIGSKDKNVYCLDAENGNKIWIYTTQGNVQSSPAVSDGKVYIGSDDYKVYCLDADNGNMIWNYTTGDLVRSSPALGDINNDGELEVVVGSLDTFVYCLDADNGNVIWKFETKGIVQSSPAIGDDGTIYVGSNDNYVYALGSTGKEKWKFETNDSVISSPALGDIDNDNQIEVVVGSLDTFVYCLDADNGNKIWKEQVGDYVGYSVQSSPALGDIDNDNQIEVVVGSHDKNLYVLDGKTGDKEWEFKADGWVDTSPALGDIDNDGRLEIVFGTGFMSVLGETRGNVYALDSDDTLPECSIVKPRKGAVYYEDEEVLYIGFITIVIGPRNGITVQVWAEDQESGIEEVRIYIDDEDYGKAVPNPLTGYYEFSWIETRFGKCNLEAVAWDKAGNNALCGKMTVWYFNIKI